ncbi:MAG: hypothetical protein R3C44_06130 [Chloroflexota bacterium]
MRLLLAATLLVIAVTACAEQQPPLTAETPGQVLFQEQFIAGQTGDWLLEQDDLSSAEIANEQLVLTINQPNTIQFATLQAPVFSDFVVEVDGRQRAGSPDSSYGVLFRVQDSQRFYRFSITSNGLYVIERHNPDGTWTRLTQDWLTSEAINQGQNVANRLKVIASGPELTFYVNDILLQQVTDATYPSGSVALSAGTFGGSSLQVSFDDLVVYGYEPDS